MLIIIILFVDTFNLCMYILNLEKTTLIVQLHNSYIINSVNATNLTNLNSNFGKSIILNIIIILIAITITDNEL